MVNRFSYVFMLVVMAISSLPACVTVTEHIAPYVSVKEELPKTVAILPFTNKTSNPDAAEAVRKMFYNFFSSLRYYDTEPYKVDSELKERGLYEKIVSGKEVSLQELGNILEVDAVISGEVTSFGKTFALLYYDFYAGLKARMVNCRTEKLIWESHDTVHQREGSVPTSPIGLAAAVVKNIVLINLDQMEDVKVSSVLCTKMINTIPNLPEITESGPGIQVLVHNGAGKLLRPGESLKVVLIGEPGLIATWDVPPVIKDFHLEEKEPGIYVGAYTVKPGDNLFAGQIVGSIQSETGAKSRWIDILGPVYMGTPTPLPQQVYKDLVLTAEKSPYLVKEPLIVTPQAKLIIEAGTVIWCKGSGIVLQGEIEAKGTKEKPIQFMNIESVPWKGIIIDQSKGNNVFSYCEVSNARNGIRARGSVVSINNCLFQNNTFGVYFEEATATIKNSIIRASRKVGISVQKSEIIINNSTVSENELGGVLLDSTKADIVYNNIYNNGEWELKLVAPVTSGPFNVPQNWWGGGEISKIRTVGPVQTRPILKKAVKTF
ncbi:MAG: GNA1162 family protein [Planctomycetota bacterium]|jgi:hypothetical protein